MLSLLTLLEMTLAAVPDEPLVKHNQQDPQHPEHRLHHHPPRQKQHRQTHYLLPQLH